jgi:hypothetical protein
MYPNSKHVETIADMESQFPLHSLLQTETYCCAGTLLSEYNTEPWEPDGKGYIEMNIQNNSYDWIGTRQEYKFTKSGLKKDTIKTYYNAMLMEANSALHFPSFKERVGIQKVVGSMPVDRTVREWELHTCKIIRCNDNQ